MLNLLKYKKPFLVFKQSICLVGGLLKQKKGQIKQRSKKIIKKKERALPGSLHLKKTQTDSYFIEELVGPVQKEEESIFSQAFPSRLCVKGYWSPDEDKLTWTSPHPQTSTDQEEFQQFCSWNTLEC